MLLQTSIYSFGPAVGKTYKNVHTQNAYINRHCCQARQSDSVRDPEIVPVRTGGWDICNNPHPLPNCHPCTERETVSQTKSHREP